MNAEEIANVKYIGMGRGLRIKMLKNINLRNGQRKNSKRTLKSRARDVRV